MESYTPEELDIPFPEIAKINIGDCPGTGTHYTPIYLFSAHTHLCKKDVNYKNICIPDKKYLFNSDGSISDLIWHEYAHVLDANHTAPFVVNCNVNGGMHEYLFPNTEIHDSYFSKDGHGESWRHIMKRFGKKPTLVVTAPS